LCAVIAENRYMRFIPVNIKWRLMSICVALVMLSTVTMGILSLRTFRTEVYTSIEEKLKIIALAWKATAQTYSKEMDMAPGRGDVLKTELLDKIAQQKIGEKGYIWVVNEKGDYVVSRGRARDGENIMNARDDKGAYFVREMIENSKKLKNAEVYIHRYPWRNSGDTKASIKISATVYIPEWGWVLGVGDYYDEFLKGLRVITFHIVAVCLLLIFVGSIAAYVFSASISRPIEQLRKISTQASEGDLNVTFDGVTDGEDEIAGLARSFESMLGKLRVKITEIEDSQRELVKTNDRLKLTQNQLLHAEKMASIGQLAAGVAHEINNPISYVMSNFETLKNYAAKLTALINKYGQLEEFLSKGESAAAEAAVKELAILKEEMELNYIMSDLQKLIGESYAGADRVRTIILDLRTFAYLGGGELKKVDVNELLDSSLNIVNADLKYKASIVKEYSDIPPVACYPQKMSQVFLNLLVNAGQAVGEKGVITIKTYQADGCVCVEIRDNGCGMPEKVKAHLFEPFFTTKPVGQGTGLGLSVAYSIMEKHNGRIEVESEEGKGSAFIVKLPQEGVVI
jgi:signal transduction histidine kinase